MRYTGGGDQADSRAADLAPLCDDLRRPGSRHRRIAFVVAAVSLAVILLAVALNSSGIPVRLLSTEGLPYVTVSNASCVPQIGRVTVSATLANGERFVTVATVSATVVNGSGAPIGEGGPGWIEVSGRGSRAVSFRVATSGRPASCNLRAVVAPPPGFATGYGVGT